MAARKKEADVLPQVVSDRHQGAAVPGVSAPPAQSSSCKGKTLALSSSARVGHAIDVGAGSSSQTPKKSVEREAEGANAVNDSKRKRSLRSPEEVERARKLANTGSLERGTLAGGKLRQENKRLRDENGLLKEELVEVKTRMKILEEELARVRAEMEAMKAVNAPPTLSQQDISPPPANRQPQKMQEQAKRQPEPAKRKPKKKEEKQLLNHVPQYQRKQQRSQPPEKMPAKKRQQAEGQQLPPVSGTEAGFGGHPAKLDAPWNVVVGRRSRGGPAGTNRMMDSSQGQTRTLTQTKVPKTKEQLLRKRRPRQQALVIEKKSEEVKYSDLIKIAREQIQPSEYRTEVLRVRYSKKGEMMLELRGLNGQEADVEGFARRLQEVLGNVANIKRPQRTTGLLILDIDESVEKEEIAAAAGTSLPIRLEEAKAGLRVAKIQVPIEKALELIQGGRLSLGWSRCRVRSLEKQSTLPRCYKCLLVGHMARECKGMDLEKPCYRCGGRGHIAATCRQDLCCPVCSKVEGHLTDHMLGGRGCSSNATNPNSLRRWKVAKG